MDSIYSVTGFQPSAPPLSELDTRKSLSHLMLDRYNGIGEPKSLDGRVNPNSEGLDDEGAPSYPVEGSPAYLDQVEGASAVPKINPREIQSKIPLRFQWNENNGYCGECCTIAAGLTLGQYFSQYDVRDIAAQAPSSVNGSAQKLANGLIALGCVLLFLALFSFPFSLPLVLLAACMVVSGVSAHVAAKPGPQTDVQYLLGDNDQFTADQMRLKSVEWDNSANKSTKDFLVWVKEMSSKGYPVSIGLYTNEYLFYGNTKSSAGEPEYDHIVSVLKVESKYTDGLYHGDDVIYFSDNALWAPDPKKPQYIFSMTFDEIQKTRKQANAKDGPIYSLCCDPTYGNYGQAITGVKGDTLPCSVTTNINYESPEIVDKQNKRPAASQLQLTVTVSDLKPGVKYKLYKYDDEKKVPTSNFNADPSKAAKVWDIELTEGSTFTLTETIKSSDKAIYRAVLA